MNSLYDDWYYDNADRLKEDFLLSFTHKDLSEFILHYCGDDSEEVNFFEIHEGTFNEFLTEQFELYKQEDN